VLAYIERTGVIFQDRRFAEKCWTHDIEAPVKAADLEMTRGLDMSGNPALALNRQHAKDWAETARYERKTEVEARRLYEAITDSTNFDRDPGTREDRRRPRDFGARVVCRCASGYEDCSRFSEVPSC
jgi:hypothetical protein